MFGIEKYKIQKLKAKRLKTKIQKCTHIATIIQISIILFNFHLIFVVFAILIFLLVFSYNTSNVEIIIFISALTTDLS